MTAPEDYGPTYPGESEDERKTRRALESHVIAAASREARRLWLAREAGAELEDPQTDLLVAVFATGLHLADVRKRLQREGAEIAAKILKDEGETE